MTSRASGPRLLVTGFGPFPNAPENPTEALVRGLAGEPAEAFGARDFRAIVLPADYRKSWAALRRLYAGYAPDVVVHFGLSRKPEAITVERTARRACAPERPDAAGFAPRSGFARRVGPESLRSNLPVDAIVAALKAAGLPAAASDHAGGYVCDATLYRSLLAAPAERLVGFVHIPPEGANGLTREGLSKAARMVARIAATAWAEAAGKRDLTDPVRAHPVAAGHRQRSGSPD